MVHMCTMLLGDFLLIEHMQFLAERHAQDSHELDASDITRVSSKGMYKKLQERFGMEIWCICGTKQPNITKFQASKLASLNCA